MPELNATDHEAPRQPRGRSRPRAADPAGRTRAIGAAGTAARLLIGLVLLASVVAGEAARGLRPAAWVLALLVFPGVALAAAWLRARQHAAGLRAWLRS